MPVPLTSPAGPGAIGVPPGPTRCVGIFAPEGPGASGVPPGPTDPLFRVDPAGPEPGLVPGATAEGAEPPAPEPVPAAPPVPPVPAPPLVCATTRTVVEVRKAAVRAAKIMLLRGIG